MIMKTLYQQPPKGLSKDEWGFVISEYRSQPKQQLTIIFNLLNSDNPRAEAVRIKIKGAYANSQQNNHFLIKLSSCLAVMTGNAPALYYHPPLRFTTQELGIPAGVDIKANQSMTSDSSRHQCILQ